MKFLKTLLFIPLSLLLMGQASYTSGPSYPTPAGYHFTGPLTLTVTLDDPSGDEYVIDVAYTVNKATSGDATAIRLIATETAVPANHYFLDFGVGASTRYLVSNAGNVVQAGDLTLTSGGTIDTTSNGDLILAPNGSGDVLANDTDLIVDDTTTGSTVNSPNFFMRGNHWTGAANVEIEALIYLDEGTDNPYLSFGVDDDGASALLVEVFRMYDTVITFPADNTVDIGAAGATRPKDIHIAGDLYYGSQLFGANGDAIENNGAGTFTLASLGHTNNENLSFDLETVADQVGVSSSTGVATIEWGGLTHNATSLSLSGTLTLEDGANFTQTDTSTSGAEASWTVTPGAARTDPVISVTGAGTAWGSGAKAVLIDSSADADLIGIRMDTHATSQQTHFEIQSSGPGQTFRISTTSGDEPEILGVGRDLYVGRSALSLIQFSTTNQFQQLNDSTAATVWEFVPTGTADLTASSGTQTYVKIAPDLDQTGTAGSNGLSIVPTVTALGSGTHNLLYLDSSANASLNGIQIVGNGSATNKFFDYQYGAGIQRLFMEHNPSVGTRVYGTTAALIVGKENQASTTWGNANILHTIRADLASGDMHKFTTLTDAELTASSGSQNFFFIEPEILQTGTASYTGLMITSTESSTGSGTKRLIQAGTSGDTDAFYVDNGASVVISNGTGDFINNGGGTGGDVLTDRVIIDGNGSSQLLFLGGTPASYGAFVYSPDDGLLFAPGNNPSGTTNNHFVLTSYSSIYTDHDHDALSPDPTLFGHSSTSPATSNNEWWSITHNNDNMVISTGALTGVGSAPTTNPQGIQKQIGGTDALYEHACAVQSTGVGPDECFAIDIAVGEAWHVETKCIAREGDTNRASYQTSATYYRAAAGNVTEEGEASIYSVESNAAWGGLDYAADVGNQTIDVQVNGLAVTTIDWKCWIKAIQID